MISMFYNTWLVSSCGRSDLLSQTIYRENPSPRPGRGVTTWGLTAGITRSSSLCFH